MCERSFGDLQLQPSSADRHQMTPFPVRFILVQLVRNTKYLIILSHRDGVQQRYTEADALTSSRSRIPINKANESHAFPGDLFNKYGVPQTDPSMYSTFATAGEKGILCILP